MAASGAVGREAAQTALETEVKATYLYKIAPYVSWPARPGKGGTDGQTSAGPFAICLVGGDPFVGVLDRAVAGQKVGARPIIVLRLAGVEHDTSCQMVVLSGPDAGVRDALRQLRGAPVLTVTQAATAPGMVDLKVVGGRVRFSIDDAAAAESGLTISSKLLSLALSVKPRPNPGSGGR